MKNKTVKWVLGHKVAVYDTAGNFDLMFCETPPQVPGPPPHLHTNLKETFLVVEGEMEFMVNGEIKIVKAGESVDLEPNTLHTFSNKTDKACKFINIHSPKGFRKFFEDLGVDAEEEDAVKKSISSEAISRVMETAASYDMMIKV